MSEAIHHVSRKPSISLTAAAENRIVSYLSEHHHQGLRLSVKKTGCSGLSYVLDYMKEALKDDLIIKLEQGFFVSLDKASYPYLNGVEIDYVQQGLGSKFIFNNPNQTGQCGCGESFTVNPPETPEQ